MAIPGGRRADPRPRDRDEPAGPAAVALVSRRMASVEQRSRAVERACSTRAPTTRPDFDPEPGARCGPRSTSSRPAARRRSRSTTTSAPGTRTSSTSSRRAPLRDVPDAGRRGGRRPGQALGHRAHLRVQRDPRLLRPGLLVHLAGHHPRARPGLAERERGRAAPRGRAARGRRDLRVRPVREGPRRRHLLDRHAADARRRRRLQRERQQVLHRQRQRRRHGLGVRPPRRRRGPRRLRLLRRRQPPPGLPPGQERRQLAEVRQRVPARGLPGARRGRPAHRARPPSTPRSTRSTSASSTSASPRSASASTPSTRRSPTPTAAILYGTRSPTSRTCASC